LAEPNVRSTAELHDIDRPVAGALWAALESFGRLPRAVVTRLPDATLISSRSPYATFNNVIDTHLPDDATTDARIREVLASFAPDSLPVTWWVGPTTTPGDLALRLQRLGLTREEPEFGMALDLSASPAAAEEEARARFGRAGSERDVRIEPVEDLDGLADWLSVMGCAYGWPDEPKASLFRAMHVRDLERTGDEREVQHFVVRADGRALAASSLFMADGHAFVTNIGTVPEARGRGLGTAATMATLDLARGLGREVATLTASVSGRGVYQRLGFREGGVLDRWIAGPHVLAALGGPPATAEATRVAG
jgi:ribosomal protein S18 acetylase RimI-like enzyme